MQPDDRFLARWFASILMYFYLHRAQTHWRALAIFPNRAADNSVEEPYRPLLDHPWVQRVYLDELAQQPNLTPGVRVLLLLVEPPVAAAEKARALLTDCRGRLEPPVWPDLLDLIETILVLKLPGKTPEEIRNMLGFEDISLKDTRFYKDVFAEGHQEGRQEGRQEGIFEGQQTSGAAPAVCGSLD